MGTIYVVDARVAKRAGLAVAAFGDVEDDRVTIDATIMATASVYGSDLWTGDAGHMTRLRDRYEDFRDVIVNVI
jgi:hypothetical protein